MYPLKNYKSNALCMHSYNCRTTSSWGLLNSKMETLDSAVSTPSRTSDSKPQTSSPLPPSVLRQWRQAAQRNLRNQWSQLASCKNRWSSVSSAGRSHATSLVNSHLSQRYMPDMKLGVLGDMPDIRKKACLKLFKRQLTWRGKKKLYYNECQEFGCIVSVASDEAGKCGLYGLLLELQRSKLLLSYKDMVGIVSDMINASRSMKCFLKGSNNSPLLQFSYNSADQSDGGDGDGIPIFAFYSITSHEKFAEELVQMFSLELCLKRLLVLEFMSIGYDNSEVKQLHWSTQLYDDEFKDLRECNLYCEVTHGPVPPRLRDGKSDVGSLRFDNQPNSEVLQVYLTTWLAEANIDTLQ